MFIIILFIFKYFSVAGSLKKYIVEYRNAYKYENLIYSIMVEESSKTELIQALVTPEEKKLLEEDANAEQRSLSSYVRIKLLENLKKGNKK